MTKTANGANAAPGNAFDLSRRTGDSFAVAMQRGATRARINARNNAKRLAEAGTPGAIEFNPAAPTVTGAATSAAQLLRSDAIRRGGL